MMNDLPTTSETPLPLARPSQTKIVATVGPACASEDQLAELIHAGVDVFRLNAAHGDAAERDAHLKAVHGAARRIGRPVGVLLDLAGPKIRLGELPDGELTLDANQPVRFVRRPGPSRGTMPELTSTYERLIDELAEGDRILLADGTVSLLVQQRTADSAVCRVIQPGTIRSRQGVNLPGVKLSVPPLGPADREAAQWAAERGIDFVGLSFVRSAAEVGELQALLRAEGATAQVIAKIEKPEALEQLDPIVEAADGVMVARGDLGVEIDIATMAVAQKQIVGACRRHGKPVIVATQMLDSMQHSRIPTRAEVADVANAILDGVDACMLSGETAVGRYPREAVEMMHRIALATEPLCRNRARVRVPEPPLGSIKPITAAVVEAAGRVAEQLEARLVVVASASGATALWLSKNRYYVPTLGVSDSEATLRRMCLYWGVIPLPDAPAQSKDALLRHVVGWGRGAGFLRPGDRIVVVAGTGLAGTAHNLIVVHEIDY